MSLCLSESSVAFFSSFFFSNYDLIFSAFLQHRPKRETSVLKLCLGGRVGSMCNA